MINVMINAWAAWEFASVRRKQSFDRSAACPGGTSINDQGEGKKDGSRMTSARVSP